MQTLEVSDAVYNEIISRRIGREAISKTIQRELKPAKKCAVCEELELLSKEPHYTADEVEKILGI